MNNQDIQDWTMSDYDVTSHTKVRRIPERGHYDEETVHSIIDSSLICHVGFIEQERPFVIPCIHGRDGRTLYLHGAKASRLMAESGSGKPCLLYTSPSPRDATLSRMPSSA